MLLKKTTNHSAPGPTSHTWAILKWAWEADADCITNLLVACPHAGHHPSQWKEATVCVIPKPKQADYMMAKNYCPISLLKCMGKLLKNVAVHLIYSDLTNFLLVPTNQYGRWVSSSTLDAGIALLHDIQSAQKASLKAGLLLFDIQGFFDNINCSQLVQIIKNLGFVLEIVAWCKSFLQNRMVRLHFNGRTS